jgi:hypothetical protein
MAAPASLDSMRTLRSTCSEEIATPSAVGGCMFELLIHTPLFGRMEKIVNLVSIVLSVKPQCAPSPQQHCIIIRQNCGLSTPHCNFETGAIHTELIRGQSTPQALTLSISRHGLQPNELPTVCTSLDVFLLSAQVCWLMIPVYSKCIPASQFSLCFQLTMTEIYPVKGSLCPGHTSHEGKQLGHILL